MARAAFLICQMTTEPEPTPQQQCAEAFATRGFEAVRLVAMRFALLGLEEVQLEEATVTGVPEHVLVWTRVTWQEVRAGLLHFLQGAEIGEYRWCEAWTEEGRTMRVLRRFK